MVAALPLTHPQPRFSANERLKHAFRPWFWGSIAVATLIHFMLLAFWPQMPVAEIAPPRAPLAMTIPPEIRIPPPPEELPRPAVPLVGDVHLSPETTLPEMAELFRSRAELPAPPTRHAAPAEQPPFTPYTVAPDLRSPQRAELQRYLERNYPPALRDAGIGARAVLWVHIDEAGHVLATRVVSSSGYPAFDELAQEALQRVRFSPALNFDRRVPVWIQLPIQFQVR
jgi:periplasmic protein TonB